MDARRAVPHAIPYQGSKRLLADAIISRLPASVDRLIEPFCGSAAVTLAALHQSVVGTAVISDINRPLIEIWERIQQFPSDLADKYETLWHGQIGNEREFYNCVREEFNRTQRPELLLYLLARCVKASVRYNSRGEFNQGPDNRRLGMRPETMRESIMQVSKLISRRVRIVHGDYRDIVNSLQNNDVIYMDPPYQGLSNNRTSRYIRGFDHGAFIDILAELERRDAKFIVSYDGKTGDKLHGSELPAFLHLRKIELSAGVSTQATLLRRNELTFESLYLSRSLHSELASRGRRTTQLAMLFESRSA